MRYNSRVTAITFTAIPDILTRADAAAFVPLGGQARAQVNVENLFGTRYYATSLGITTSCRAHLGRFGCRS